MTGIRVAVIKQVPSLLPLFIAAALIGCSDPSGGGLDAGVDANTSQGSSATGELVVNEVAPRTADGIDWLELVNRSSETLDLCDYFATDSLDRLDHYLPLGGTPPPEPCSPRLLGVGEYLVIFADDDVAAGIDHAPFKLGQADGAHVVTATGLTVDSLLYLYPDNGEGSLSRYPDGEGPFYLVEPTPGSANTEVTQ